MVRILLYIAFSLLIFSCGKDDSISNNTDVIPESIMPLEVGNYWIYDIYIENENGQLQLSPISDSIYVDSVENINGENYYNLAGFLTGETYVKVRDSLGYLVSSDGLILYSPNNDEGVISTQEIPYQTSSFIYINYEMGDKEEVSVPAGTFEARRVIGNVDLSETDFNCDKLISSHFVEGIGRIRDQLFYLSDCRFTIRELARYNVQ